LIAPETMAITYGLSSAMLSSLFPAATVTLAWFFLKEKLNHHQWCGVVVALAALFLISA